jgi:DNA-binding transcriptional MerR regulator
MENQLEFFKDRKFVGVAELAETAARILEASDSRQDRETVREYPDERTVRFYLSENLIPASFEKQGTASVFGYRHLLVLLAVKKLQAESIPIRKIREIIAGRNESELEKLLGVKTAEKNKFKNKDQKTKKNEAHQFLETLLLQSRRAVPEHEEGIAAARIPMQSRLRQSIKPKKGEGWKRYEIAPGLELHIRENFRISFSREEIEQLIENFKQIIRSVKK